ncbi:hypothetical protein CgunFtcFv8_018886 [Champsocephalus gunnari]|uniref:Uncharacterized protein n=1 Tax=Champsocephalus gunnari TaxID=52237 RepID=A0AAN8DI73_CHAGU|nr:hypothetical protein CgunFtcFv8_018886 [Champsocephalus gunnari]
MRGGGCEGGLWRRGGGKRPPPPAATPPTAPVCEGDNQGAFPWMEGRGAPEAQGGRAPEVRRRGGPPPGA